MEIVIFHFVFKHEIQKLRYIDSLELVLNSIPDYVLITNVQPWLWEDAIPFVIRVIPRDW